MAIEQLEGGIVGLDAHLDELLQLYTNEHNRWFREATAKGRECPFAPTEIGPEEMARLILGRFLHEWSQQQRDKR
jgi:hypothetical protein